MRKNRLTIILSDKERDRVIAEASREGLSLSAWARMMITRALDRIEDNRDINPYLMTDAELKEDEQKRRRWRD